MASFDLFWTPACGVSLDAFLDKNKPSTILDYGDKPWTWVQRTDSVSHKEEPAELVDTAKSLLEAATSEIQRITDDASIPPRARKGIKSKKQRCDEVRAQFAASVRDLCVEAGCTTGKWLVFRGTDKIDETFAAIARSLISGPLSKSPARLMKAATMPADVSDPNHQHVIVVYLDNIYDKEDALHVLTALSDEGILSTAAKSDLYTMIGLDSKHPSKIRSSIWQPKELTDADELKKKVAAYWEDQRTEKDAKRNAELEDKGVKRKAPEVVEAEQKKVKVRRANQQFDNPDSNSEPEKGLPTSSSSSRSQPPAPSNNVTSPSKSIPKPRAAFDGASEEDDEPPPAASSSLKTKRPSKPARKKGLGKEKEEEASSESEEERVKRKVVEVVEEKPAKSKDSEKTKEKYVLSGSETE